MYEDEWKRVIAAIRERAKWTPGDAISALARDMELLEGPASPPLPEGFADLAPDNPPDDSRVITMCCRGTGNPLLPGETCTFNLRADLPSDGVTMPTHGRFLFSPSALRLDEAILGGMLLVVGGGLAHYYNLLSFRTGYAKGRRFYYQDTITVVLTNVGDKSEMVAPFMVQLYDRETDK